MNTIENIKQVFHRLQSQNGSSVLTPIEKKAYDVFNKLGVPTVKNEEWKYTRISSVFNREFKLTQDKPGSVTLADLDGIRLPGYEEANELVFVNGQYVPSLSSVRSAELEILPLEKAASNEYAEIVKNNLGHSGSYLKDGIHALNTAFLQNGVFIHVKRGQITEHPVYIYHITDARTVNMLSQPRTLVHISEGAQVQITETYSTLGQSAAFTNQVIEIVVEKDAMVEYYKIQNDGAQTSQVSTTHFRQTGKSYIHAVTVSLNGDIVRNNLNIVMEADHAEAHLYGLYFLQGKTHVDNHTVVDNVRPNCLSNELYKGIINDQASAVFNGKIFVQQVAQKTNAYQSNKNILLSENASVNTKPQLEIFADDVKCSHGCTVGQLDEEGMFYLQSRGISEKIARSLLVHAFAVDILEHIKPVLLRNYIDQLISDRLEYDIA
ncbi:MAG: Fe-S cluster assembly protein SufD [Flavisolibacter sp.]|jgi:Fe-S cluster assembly protein SufD